MVNYTAITDSKPAPFVKPETVTTEITNAFYWWLSAKRPFRIDDKYELSLLCLDFEKGSAKILIKNLETNTEYIQYNNDLDMNDLDPNFNY